MVPRLVAALLVSWALGTASTAGPPPAPVPRTGQNTCCDGTAVVPCTGTGQDGDTRTGVIWPVPRFTEADDRTITDNLSGLTWTRDANPAGGHKTWQQALEYVKTLNHQTHLGYDDWRLPNVNELESLVNKQPDLAGWLASQGFRNIQAPYYWTSSSYANHPAYAWSVGTYSGIVAARGKEDGGHVWPVRDGALGASTLPKTGQTSCHDASGSPVACAGTGQDGDFQAGVEWPGPRFADNSDQTLSDRLTGLVWPKDAGTPGPLNCEPGGPKTWQGALRYVKCLNASAFLTKTDWRLPNRNELASLVNRGQPNTATWLKERGFSNVQASSYWSSSTYPYPIWNIWSVNLHDGAVTSMAERHEIHAWPVRGGQQTAQDPPKGRR